MRSAELSMVFAVRLAGFSQKAQHLQPQLTGGPQVTEAAEAQAERNCGISYSASRLPAIFQMRK